MALKVLLPSPPKRQDSAFCKSTSVLGFVLQNNGIMDRVPCQSMQTHDFALTFAANGGLFGQSACHGCLFQRDGRAAWRVQLVHVVNFANVCRVSLKLGHDLARMLGNGIQGMDPRAEVGGPKSRCSMFLGQLGQVRHGVVPPHGERARAPENIFRVELIDCARRFEKIKKLR